MRILNYQPSIVLLNTRLKGLDDSSIWNFVDELVIFIKNTILREAMKNSAVIRDCDECNGIVVKIHLSEVAKDLLQEIYDYDMGKPEDIINDIIDGGLYKWEEVMDGIKEKKI